MSRRDMSARTFKFNFVHSFAFCNFFSPPPPLCGPSCAESPGDRWKAVPPPFSWTCSWSRPVWAPSERPPCCCPAERRRWSPAAECRWWETSAPQTPPWLAAACCRHDTSAAQCTWSWPCWGGRPRIRPPRDACMAPADRRRQRRNRGDSDSTGVWWWISPVLLLRWRVAVLHWAGQPTEVECVQSWI